MPFAQFLQSIKVQCRYRHQQTGVFHRNHQDCQETHQADWQEMVQLAAQAASADSFNETALRQSLQAIATRAGPPARTSTAPWRRASGRAWPRP